MQRIRVVVALLGAAVAASLSGCGPHCGELPPPQGALLFMPIPAGSSPVVYVALPARYDASPVGPDGHALLSVVFWIDPECGGGMVGAPAPVSVLTQDLSVPSPWTAESGRDGLHLARVPVGHHVAVKISAIGSPEHVVTVVLDDASQRLLVIGPGAIPPR